MSLEQRDRLLALLRARQPAASMAARREAFEQFAARLWPDAPPPPEPMSIAPALSGRMCPPPSGREDRLLIWLHGGAFAVGSSASFSPLAFAIAAAADCTVLLPDYRLAPEHPYPAAQEDARTSVDWALTQGWSGARLALGGDSAGGNLALGAAQNLARRGDAPGGLWLISPYLDLTHASHSMRTRRARDGFVNPDDGTNARYAGGVPFTDPGVSPLFGDMAGLPPVLVQVGSEEVLFDDALRLSQGIWAAGGEAVFQEWPGMFHVWPLFAAGLEEGIAAIAQGGNFLRSHVWSRAG